jgi:hypothetical protein
MLCRHVIEDDDAYTTVCSLTLSTSVSERLPSIEGVLSLAQSRHEDRGWLKFSVKVDEGQRVVIGCVSELNSKTAHHLFGLPKST